MPKKQKKSRKQIAKEVYDRKLARGCKTYFIFDEPEIVEKVKEYYKSIRLQMRTMYRGKKIENLQT